MRIRILMAFALCAPMAFGGFLLNHFALAQPVDPNVKKNLLEGQKREATASLCGVKIPRVPTLPASPPGMVGGRPGMMVGREDYAVYQRKVDIYNETLAEYEERLCAYETGLETEASLFEMMERVHLASKNNLASITNGPFPKEKIAILEALSERAEAVRKTMLARTQDNKLGAKARADLHRARCLCLNITLQLYEAQTPGQMNGPQPKLTPVP